jgi:(2Fe-2S) ferredoxin
MSHFTHHVFFCTNQRADGEACCNNFNAQNMRDYVKSKVKKLGISSAENRIRINSAGCMDRCDAGPVLVVYPEAVWYTYVDEQDLDEIIEEHLKNGRIVERLRIADIDSGQSK